MRAFVASLAVLASCSFAQGQDAKPLPKVKLLPMASDAYGVVLQDLMQMPEASRPYLRYLWVQDGQQETGQVGSLAMNIVSRATTVVRPQALGKDAMLLLRVDLRHYAPKERDLKEWVSLWEDFQFDPALNLLITKGTIATATQSFPDWKGTGYVCRQSQVQVSCPPYQHEGTTYTTKWVWQRTAKLEQIALANLKDVELVRVPAPFVSQKIYEACAEMTYSQAPMVTANYFLYRALSTIEDKGVYSIVYGGRYYQLAGIRRGAKKGTDEDVLLEQLGVGSVANGITAKKIFDELRSDQRAAIFRSGVTGSPRRMDFFRTLSGRLDIASGLISITHDLKNQNIDIDTHPVANLLDFKDAAREVIWERQNGLHGYALFNGNGVLQDEVPPDVAKDHTIPAPHTGRLQSAISCIACHETEGSDGWKRVVNDVKKLTDGKGKPDIFGDTSRPHDTLADTLDRLAGLYQGDPERALMRGRDDYAAAVLRATGPWKASKQGQTDVVKLAAGKLVGQWRGHYYDLVDAERALREIGVECVDRKEAQRLLELVLQPDLRAGQPIGIVPEDPRIGALRAGISIGRADWDLVFAFAADRGRQNLATLLHVQPKEKK